MLFNGILVSVDGQIDEEIENQNAVQTKLITETDEEKQGSMLRKNEGSKTDIISKDIDENTTSNDLISQRV